MNFSMRISLNLCITCTMYTLYILYLIYFKVVFVGPFEHHSNLLPWLETGADIIHIKETVDGLVDILHLKEKLEVMIFIFSYAGI